MPGKSLQLQIRVTRDQKARLRQLARSAGQDVSTWVLARALPEPRARFHETVRALRSVRERRYALAALADLIAGLTNAQFVTALATVPEHFTDLPSRTQNYVAAMIEQASAERDIAPPAWTRDVAPLDAPWFATTLRSLRLHLLRVAPAAFRRRNLFVDAGAGGRV
jgi:uncharacterized protein (DUF1778 family)